jgi:hypothetical protein
MLGEGLLLLAEYVAKAIHLGFARLAFSFDRDASKTFWYTFDADDNRNISRFQRNRRWSVSIFSICPTILVSYQVKIQGVTIYAYHGADRRWIKLEDHAGGVFPGPSVRRDVGTFLTTYPPLREKQLHAHEAETARITKIGVFDQSLSAEFVLSSQAWGGVGRGDYVALAVILHVNTKYLFFTCLVPEMTGSRPEPAYFIGQPTIYKINDETAMLERASGDLANADQLGRTERTTVYWKIS